MIFDMSIPFEMENRQAELKRRVDEAVHRESDRYFTVITFDETSFHGREEAE